MLWGCLRCPRRAGGVGAFALGFLLRLRVFAWVFLRIVASGFLLRSVRFCYCWRGAKGQLTIKSSVMGGLRCLRRAVGLGALLWGFCSACAVVASGFSVRSLRFRCGEVLQKYN